MLILFPRSYTHAISLSPESLELPTRNWRKASIQRQLLWNPKPCSQETLLKTMHCLAMNRTWVGRPGDSVVLPHSAVSPNLEQAMLTTAMTAVLSTLGTNR